MLRSARVADAPILARLLTEQFPEERRYLGIDPAAMEAVARRAFSWRYRFMLGALRLFGRPIVNVFVIEEDQRMVAGAILTYAPKAGFVSGVVVDPAYRRRGHAKTILDACRKAAARAGRKYITLEVLADNAPARALYEELGYRAFRESAFFVQEPWVAPANPASGEGIRGFERTDADQLAEIATSNLPSEVAEVLPIHKGEFLVPGIVVSALRSESRGWVLDGPSGPRGFIRATASQHAKAGHLTSPVFSRDVSAEDRARLLDYAVAWFGTRPVPRLVVEIPRFATDNLQMFRERGFVEALDLLTLVRPTVR